MNAFKEDPKKIKDIGSKLAMELGQKFAKQASQNSDIKSKEILLEDVDFENNDNYARE